MAEWSIALDCKSSAYGLRRFESCPAHKIKCQHLRGWLTLHLELFAKALPPFVILEMMQVVGHFLLGKFEFDVDVINLESAATFLSFIPDDFPWSEMLDESLASSKSKSHAKNWQEGKFVLS